jgi:DNA-3-methyladenine glycosylase II
MGQQMITLKRAYEPVSRSDGARLLVERLWPRGVSKAQLRVDAWLKEAGPSTELRKWFSHDPEKWDEFRRRYFRELDSRPEAWQRIVSAARCGRVTLVYSSHDTHHNNAVALQEYVQAKARRPAASHRAVAAGHRQRLVRSIVVRNRHQASRTFVLRPIPPFRLDLTVWVLRRRQRNAIDRWDGRTYRRVIVLAGRPTELAVRQAGSSAAPRLIVTATPRPRTVLENTRVRSMVDRLLGLRVDLTDWYQMAARDVRLRPLADTFRGMKPPRFPTMFEAVVNAFACQQVSLEVGLELLNRLATLAGAGFGRPDHSGYAFPTACDVSRQAPGTYRAIGFSRQKVRALLDLARAITRHELDLELLQQKDDAVARERLLELRGVGRWTAEYVLLRGVGRLHVFPGDDVGAQKRLARWLGRSRPLDYAGVHRAVDRWQPFTGLVYFHLLLDGLAQAGALESRARG